ncbi:MAG: hypothetical protein F4X36_01715, partial [Gammaproteobacteria bacterium]|nr:hypothetical protein [Gammaproteobacteria bacterium]
MTHWLPGDIVARRKGFLMHQGVVLRDGTVLHNTPLRGEHVSTEAEFRRGKPMRVRRLGEAERGSTLRYAEQGERRGYNLFTNNCEHTVTRAAGGRAESPQLATWVAGVGTAAVAFALTRHPLVAAAGYALGRQVARRLA